MLKRLLFPLAFLAFTTLLAAEEASSKANDYTWTTDHMHVGVRWQPVGSAPLGNAYDATQPVISEDAGYVQFWVSWAAVEPKERNQDYLKKPASGLRCIEQCVDECIDRGLKVEFVFFHAPAWATVEGKSGGFRAKDGLFGLFIERIARHFKGRVHAYQLAHEANLQALFEGASIDYVINELLVAGAKSVRKVYAEEPALPVIVSTSGGSPCHGCPTVEGLGAISGEGLHRFYDFLLASPELMNLVDALNMNVSDQNNGFGTMDGNWVSSVWDNYDIVRSKLDATEYKNKTILASESWITWDAGRTAIDVNGDGKKNEQDAYDKTVTIMGKCLERGLNTFNLPWRDNSSEWSMGLTKRRDYNGRVKTLNPDFVTPANDGGADIVTQKLALKGNDDDFVFGTLAERNVSFTVKDYINPADPHHLHYYLWRWYGQIACGTDEAIRHALAGEINNNIALQGVAFTGNETYRLSSWNRTKEEFTVLLYASGAGANGISWLQIPSTIQAGKHYNTGKNEKHDFRGEGIKVGENYIATVETKNISREDGSDEDLVTYTSKVGQVKEDGTCTVFLKNINKFTKVTIRKTDKPLPKSRKGGR